MILALLLTQIWPFSNLSQQHPRCRNTSHTVAKRTQHVALNNGAICCVGILGSFGRGLNTQHVATCRNMLQHGGQTMQHVAPNNVAICCVGMLRSFGRALRWTARELISVTCFFSSLHKIGSFLISRNPAFYFHVSSALSVKSDTQNVNKSPARLAWMDRRDASI